MKVSLLQSRDISQLEKADFLNILMIIATWVSMTILVNPVGDFPLNDDWAYGWSVKTLLEKGDFQLSGWTATNLFSQVFWGALFCLPFGFSFTALRFSTLILGLIGVITTYGLLREVNSSPKISLIGALIVAINPIYFSLSNSFMNDVHFFAFAILSLYFLLRGLKNKSKIEIFIGIFISYIAILNRQVGLAIPLAFGCAYLVKSGIKIQSSIKGFLPTVIGMGIQILYQTWLRTTMRLPANYGNQIKTLLTESAQGLFHQFFNLSKISLISLIYLGLFIFPFLVMMSVTKYKNYSLLQRKIFIFGSSAIFIFNIILMKVLLKPRLIPLVNNILINFGVGPIGLNDDGLPKAPKIILLLITVIGVLGAVLLIQYLFLAIARLFVSHFKEKLITILILSLIIIYLMPLGLLGLSPFGFYDRYLIFLLPLLMILIALLTHDSIFKNASEKYISVALAMMLFYAAFTVGATHDYLSWNRSRWNALNYLTQELKISPKQINGGFEFNGWYLYDSNKEFGWVDKDDYVVAFNPLSGYEQFKQYSYSRWIPFGEGKILILRKTSIS